MSNIQEAIIRLKDSLKAHNNDCLLCALKDTRTNEALVLLKSEPEPTEFTKVQRKAVQLCLDAYETEEWMGAGGVGIQRLIEACDIIDNLTAWKGVYQSKIKEVKHSFEEMKELYETVSRFRAEDRKEVDSLTAELISANDGVDHGNEVIESLTVENKRLMDLVTEALIKHGLRSQSDDEIEALLDAMDDEPLSEEKIKRILAKAKPRLIYGKCPKCKARTKSERTSHE